MGSPLKELGGSSWQHQQIWLDELRPRFVTLNYLRAVVFLDAGKRQQVRVCSQKRGPVGARQPDGDKLCKCNRDRVMVARRVAFGGVVALDSRYNTCLGLGVRQAAQVKKAHANVRGVCPLVARQARVLKGG